MDHRITLLRNVQLRGSIPGGEDQTLMAPVAVDIKESTDFGQPTLSVREALSARSPQQVTTVILSKTQSISDPVQARPSSGDQRATMNGVRRRRQSCFRTHAAGIRSPGHGLWNRPPEHERLSLPSNALWPSQ